MVSLSKINIPPRKRPKIIVIPLDWGLGHATRCIPIIKELLNQECEVWIAASGSQKSLLGQEFPFVPIVELPGYGITYGKDRAFTVLKLLFSVPKIWFSIRAERRWLDTFLIRESMDMVISDNRYGLYSSRVKSVFMTHQLSIRSGFGPFADRLLRKLHFRMIDRFDECWIPDLEEGDGLAGKLSHPGKSLDIPSRYVGLLSRFAPLPEDRPSAGTCDLLVLISGPEPQRSIFEEMMLKELKDHSCRWVLVRGVPGENAVKEMGDGSVYDHMPAAELENLMRGAGLVIARSGYSTVMDLVTLGKKAVLVPTPGQTEQEYLGRYLSGKRIALCMQQRVFSLQLALAMAEGFRPQTVNGTDQALLKAAIRDLFAGAQ